MPRNIELKARVEDFERTTEVARGVATEYLGCLRQVDTYFVCGSGRLKLREIDGSGAELIAYSRADSAEARGSDYVIAPVTRPGEIKQAFSAALGVKIVVEKESRSLLGIFLSLLPV